jgi:RNA polymerase sigma-70 factor (ECF subfamily)
VLRDEHDAEEALQNALLQVWKRLERVERHPNPAALILRMGANAAYDRLRRRIRENRLRNGRISESATDTRPSPSIRAEASELSDALRIAISTLPRKQAHAAIMRLIQELSYAEIAEALGCKEATARVHVLNARKRLEILLHDFRRVAHQEVVS